MIVNIVESGNAVCTWYSWGTGRGVSRVNYEVPRLFKLHEVAWRCSKDACNLDKLFWQLYVLEFSPVSIATTTACTTTTTNTMSTTDYFLGVPWDPKFWILCCLTNSKSTPDSNFFLLWVEELRQNGCWFEIERWCRGWYWWSRSGKWFGTGCSIRSGLGATV